MSGPPNRSALVALQAGCLVLVLLSGLLPLQHTPALFGYPINEDGYYALSAARHLGLGHGLSVDGVHPTGGVQPLWVFLVAPISWMSGGDRAAVVRGSLGLSVLLYVAASALVGTFAARLARQQGLPPRSSGWLAALLYLACGNGFESHFNLLETGLVLAIYMAVVLVAARADWQRPRTLFAIGAWCGVLILARVDTVFFVTLLVPMTVRPREAGGLRPWIARAIGVPAIAAVVAAPWFAYNFLSFGHLTPSGGLAQAADRFSPGRVLVAGMYLAGRLVPLPVDLVWPSRFEAFAAACVTAALAVLMVRPSLRSRAGALLHTRDGRALPLLLANGIVIALWYGITSRAWWMFIRYVAPAMLAGVPVLALLVASWVRERAVAAAVLVSLVVGSFVFARYPPSTDGIRERSHVFFVSVADELVPPGARLGAFQSGTLGYFRDNVVNLDGKVNERALRSQRDVMAYCDAEGIDWVADWPGVLERDFFHGPPTPGWTLVAERRLPGCVSCDFLVFRRK